MFLAFTFCWTITEELALQVQVSAYQVVWMRYGIHVAAMLLIAGPRVGTALARTHSLPKQIARSLLMLFMPLCFIMAFSRVSVQNALAFLWCTPMLLVIIDRLFTRETRGWGLPVITVLGFVGAMLMIHPTPPFHTSGLIALAGSLCFAIYVPMTRAMHDEGLLPKMFHTALWVFVALTPFVPFFWITPTIRVLFGTVLVALFGWLTLYFLDRAVDKAPPATLAPIMYGIVVWTALYHRTLYHTVLSHTALAGAVLIAIVAGIAILWSVQTTPKQRGVFRNGRFVVGDS